MVECPYSNNKYFNYKCYSKLKDYFSRNDIFKDDEDNVKNYLEHNIIKKTYTQSQIYIFYKLYNYLGGDGVFPWQDPTECCKYINYWLNTEVQKLLPDLYNKTSFEIFEKIVNYYNDNKNLSKNKRCISNIKYIESDELSKMGTLYSLYENYEILKAKKITNDTACNILVRMYLTYNDALTLHGNNDNNLFSRLKALKSLIDNILPQHNSCPPYIKFKDPESIKIKENTVSEHNTRTNDQTVITPELPRPKEESLLPEPDSRNPEGDPPSHPVLQPVMSELQAPHLRDASGTSERYESSRKALEGMNLELSQNTHVGKLKGQRLKPGSDYPEGSIYNDTLENPPFSDHVGLENLGRKSLDDGFLGKIQGFFTETLGQVEPAPILGVSGGMGALFLLFKYTPVGTFFRGRRGRTYGIPSGFNGPFPGEFPGYQDYLGGNIGYTQMNPLAE
ncbi:PIR protein [Plasmodium vivax]|uniref:VIR protein n=1 Tax=Plasmodium vivax TaxID=5855 RepID=A0A565A6P5_PLAVI|nr:PIR protein [Plasmodium vivax]